MAREPRPPASSPEESYKRITADLAQSRQNLSDAKGHLGVPERPAKAEVKKQVAEEEAASKETAQQIILKKAEEIVQMADRLVNKQPVKPPKGKQK